MAVSPLLRARPRRQYRAADVTDARDCWRLRDHANVLYGLFATATFLVRSKTMSS